MCRCVADSVRCECGNLILSRLVACYHLPTIGNKSGQKAPMPQKSHTCGNILQNKICLLALHTSRRLRSSPAVPTIQVITTPGSWFAPLPARNLCIWCGTSSRKSLLRSPSRFQACGWGIIARYSSLASHSSVSASKSLYPSDPQLAGGKPRSRTRLHSFRHGLVKSLF